MSRNIQHMRSVMESSTRYSTLLLEYIIAIKEFILSVM